MAGTRKNLKRKIASLSALGAGTLALGAGNAEAGIVYSGVLDTPVGFSLGSNQSYFSPGLGTHAATFQFIATGSSATSGGNRRIMAYGCGCLVLAQQLGFLQLFNPGDMWKNTLSTGSGVLVGGRQWFLSTSRSTSGSSSPGPSFPPGSIASFPNAFTFGNPPFAHKYALFTFDDSANSYFGWIQLSYSVSSLYGSDPSFGPDLVIHDWAYEDTGALIAAGDVGGDSVPEPSTAVSTGLAALALGATGLRRWRTSRKAA